LFEVFNHGAIFALFQVILIDLVLAGDNAIVIGMAAARIPQAERRKVIFWGLVAAVILRVFLATITVELLAVIGLMFAGGILLLWVTWRFYRDLKQAREEKKGFDALSPQMQVEPPALSALASRKMVRRAIVQIAAADLSMSLDNVLAVAGAAMHHVMILAIGLLLSIGLMGVAANYVAKLLQRYPWISYAGVFSDALSGLMVLNFVQLTMAGPSYAVAKRPGQPS
jgi:YjbE family integral membrane protein